LRIVAIKRSVMKVITPLHVILANMVRGCTIRDLPIEWTAKLISDIGIEAIDVMGAGA